MKATFTYSKEKDIWCILTKGPSSNNSQKATETYKKLLASGPDPLKENNVSAFIKKYLQTNNLNTREKIEELTGTFDVIADEFRTIAENVFNESLPKEITTYLTINNRYPYNIEEKWFFVSIGSSSPNAIIMHELWHFYTWEKFGEEEVDRIGKEKYNTIKEALTVLLNIECSHLFPEGRSNIGYPQHQELRKEIAKWWKNKQDISSIWEKSINYLGIGA